MYLLVEENVCLISCLSDLTTAVQLHLTLPVTTATADRSFSKMSLIMSYLRSTMTQMRLINLAILSNEHEETQTVDVSKEVDLFLMLKIEDYENSKLSMNLHLNMYI